MARRPNFVMFITDQHRADYLGCTGHPVLQTPNIDRIATEGTIFDRFYVASPVCMPNRASVMTGRMPSVHGVRCNGIPLSRNTVTFVDLLREAGYRTALIGKSHLQNFTNVPNVLIRPAPREGFGEPGIESQDAVRDDRSIPFYQQESPCHWYDPEAKVATPFYGFDHVELVTGHGDSVGGDYRRWLRGKDVEAERLIGPEAALAHAYQCPQALRTAVPVELYSTTYIVERVQAYLDDHARDHSDEPVFLMVSFPDPHHPFNPPGHYWDLYKPEQFAEPEAYSRNDWAPPPHVLDAMEQRETGVANLAGMGTIVVTGQEAREAQALTCGMIACIDDAVGQILDDVFSGDLTGETVTLFTTDHGDHLGDHRLLLKGAEQYQSIVRVPFLWSDPGMPRGPARTKAIASSIDIPATILERARIEPFSGMQGQSLLPVMSGEASDHREAAFIQYDHQRTQPYLGNQPRVHTLVDWRWRISVFHGADWGELYDLVSDPGEFENLWDDPASASVKAEMIERLLRAEIAYADRSPFPTALA